MNYFLRCAVIILSTTASLFGMQTEHQLNCTFTSIMRTEQFSTVVFNATLDDGTHIQMSYEKEGMRPTTGTLHYREVDENPELPLKNATYTFLRTLYPSIEDGLTIPTVRRTSIRAQLYTDLLLRLDAEFVKQHPGQKRLLFSHP